jgi:hypothetical protein
VRTKTLIWIVVIWGTLTVLNYYFVPYFILAIEWLLLSLVLFIWTIVEIGKVINERKNLSKHRLLSSLTICVLLLLTYYRQPVNRLIEKADWYVFYSKRCGIIELVKQGKLTPNGKWHNGICELSYDFPVISNGGNDIVISKNDSTGQVSVTFWVFRNFFNAPSTHFVYTNDLEEIKSIENLIKTKPQDNWKISDNWYRTFCE